MARGGIGGGIGDVDETVGDRLNERREAAEVLLCAFPVANTNEVSGGGGEV